MKFLVRQQLTPSDDAFTHHLGPLAALVADSLEDPPRRPVVWLNGCGNLETQHYYMFFEAPDRKTLEGELADLPGLYSVEQVMTVDRHTLGPKLLRALAGRHARQTR